MIIPAVPASTDLMMTLPVPILVTVMVGAVPASVSVLLVSNQLAEGLASVGLTVLPTRGTYFITTDFAPLGFDGDDDAFCRHITEKAGVTAIPVSAFYDEPGAPRHYARFAFCKKPEVLEEAIARLRRHFGA